MSGIISESTLLELNQSSESVLSQWNYLRVKYWGKTFIWLKTGKLILYITPIFWFNFIVL